MNRINYFIKNLSNSNLYTSKMTNMYSSKNDVNNIRKNNLNNYLTQMLDQKTKILLLGEAAGYNGCRLSGIPFTSEYILHNGLIINGSKYFGNDNFKIENISSPQKEQSATIVWNTIKEIGYIPLLWNAFPYHPHKKNNIKSNRTPLIDELKIGVDFLKEILDIFLGIEILAVGNKAENILKDMGIKYLGKIRHPANGGRNDFRKGILKYIKNCL